MTQRALVVLALIIAVGCGGARGAEQSSDLKPASASRSGGAEVQPTSTASTSPRAEPRDARSSDLDLQASAPSPVGAVLPAHVADFPITLRIRNRTDEPLALRAPQAIVEVWRAGRRVDGCETGPEPIDLPEVLGPRASVSTHAELPCALTDPGDYDVLSVVVVGAGERDLYAVSPTDTRRSVSTRVRIEDDFGPFGEGVIPPAQIYPPGHSGLVDPAPRDVRPEP